MSAPLTNGAAGTEDRVAVRAGSEYADIVALSLDADPFAEARGIFTVNGRGDIGGRRGYGSRNRRPRSDRARVNGRLRTGANPELPATPVVPVLYPVTPAPLPAVCP
jgi:hypothetical protein